MLENLEEGKESKRQLLEEKKQQKEVEIYKKKKNKLKNTKFELKHVKKPNIYIYMYVCT